MRDRKKKETQRFGRGMRGVATVLLATMPFLGLPDMALALPHGGVVSKGAATLGYGTNALLIHQTTGSATFDWSSYNVKAGQTVTYRTPGASSVSLNIVGGSSPAAIDGTVKSNGILEFMDANGLMFGQGSSVSAAGVMAFGSSSGWGTQTGPVSNAGTITVGTGGQVSLVGSSVTNSGTITAPGGSVILTSGATVTPVASSPGSSVSVATTGGGFVEDSGTITAETVGTETGQIVLQSGMQSGTTTLDRTALIDASAPVSGNGGSITINGNTVTLDNAAPLDVSAPYGLRGRVTIDPVTINTDSASCLETIDANQSVYLSDTINLTGNINLESGTTSYVWTPLGTSSSSPFVGTFNGNGHVVSGYTITATNNNGTGFIGYLGSGGMVENLGVAGVVYGEAYYNAGGVVGCNAGTVEYSFNTGSISGSNNSVGGVAGINNGGTIKYSYNTGTVNGGSADHIGGVAGYDNAGTIEYVYNTGSVSGGSCVGGVVGVIHANSLIVQYSYNTGSVSGSGYVGGVVGQSYGQVEYSYNTGSVSGTGSNIGGVVGYNNSGTVTDTYYNATVFTGQGIGNGGTGASGLIEGTGTGQLGNSGSYSGWIFAGNWNGNGYSTSGTWTMGTVYPNGGSAGVAAPILVGDLPSLTVTANSNSSVYTGNIVQTGTVQSVTMGGSPLSSGIVSETSGSNVGPYNVTPTVSPLAAPATQTSLGSATSVNGTWTINPAPLTLSTTGSKVYDGNGSLTLSGSNATLSGAVSGQSASIGTPVTGTLTFPNAGTGIGGSVSLVPSDMTGNTAFSTALAAGDYTLPSSFTGGTITHAPLTLSTSASNVYSGSLGISLSGANSTLSGFVNGQNGGLISATGTLSSANFGNNLSGTVSLTTANLNSGSGTGFLWSNYSLPSSFTGGSITPLDVTATANTASMTYGGTVPSLTGTLSPSNGPSLAGLTATWSTQATSASNVGSYPITHTIIVPAGAESSDFSVTSVNNSGLTVNPATLTVSGSMVYDGATVFPSKDLSVTGVNGQTFTASGSGTLSSPNVQTDKPLASVSGLTLTGNDGAVASNYEPISANDTAISVGTLDVTLTANSVSVPQGDKIPALSGTVTPLLPGFTVAWSTSATSGSRPGTYAITPTYTLPIGATSEDISVINDSGNDAALIILPTLDHLAIGNSDLVIPSFSGMVPAGEMTAPSPISSTNTVAIGSGNDSVPTGYATVTDGNGSITSSASSVSWIAGNFLK